MNLSDNSMKYSKTSKTCKMLFSVFICFIHPSNTDHSMSIHLFLVRNEQEKSDKEKEKADLTDTFQPPGSQMTTLRSFNRSRYIDIFE